MASELIGAGIQFSKRERLMIAEDGSLIGFLCGLVFEPAREWRFTKMSHPRAAELGRRRGYDVRNVLWRETGRLDLWVRHVWQHSEGILNHLGQGDFHFLAISEFSLLISIMAPTFRFRSLWTER